MENNKLRDKLIGALVGLARATDSHEHELTEDTYSVLLEGIYALDGSAQKLPAAIAAVRGEKARVTPDCAACQYPCGRTNDYDMEELYTSSEEVREAKLRLLDGIIAYAKALHEPAEEQYKLLCKGLFYIGEYVTPEQIEPVLREIS